MTVAKRELGRTGLQVTTLGYGAMKLRGVGAAVWMGKRFSSCSPRSRCAGTAL
jgi:aryl-alcohol dehydrogenase-like predicted oxidoreductase